MTEDQKPDLTDYLRPVLDDRERFDTELAKISRYYIQPAVDNAASDLNPSPTALIHALFVAAFNACRQAADADWKASPDHPLDTTAERNAYAMFEKIAASALDLISIGHL
jgi:hypothetical protein